MRSENVDIFGEYIGCWIHAGSASSIAPSVAALVEQHDGLLVAVMGRDDLGALRRLEIGQDRREHLSLGLLGPAAHDDVMAQHVARAGSERLGRGVARPDVADHPRDIAARVGLLEIDERGMRIGAGVIPVGDLVDGEPHAEHRLQQLAGVIELIAESSFQRGNARTPTSAHTRTWIGRGSPVFG